MKIGYNEATAMGCSDLLTDLKLCEKEGFDYIEIRFDMLEGFLKKHMLGELKEFFKNSRIKPHAFNALYIYEDMFSKRDTEEKRRGAEKQFDMALKIGREIGSHYLIVVPPLREPEYGENFGTVKKSCVRILSELADRAMEYEMNLCFETVGLKKSSVRNISRAMEIVETVDRKNLGYVFDSYNIFSYNMDNSFEELRKADVKKLFAVHINNADSCREGEMSQDKRRFCDQGILCLDNFLGILKEMGYEGMVSIETFRPEYWAMEPSRVIRRAYRTTREIMERNGCFFYTEKQAAPHA